MNSIPTNLWEWLAPIEPDERFVLCITTIVVGLIAMVFVAGIVARTIGKIHRSRLEISLKHDMLDRGMSAEEIARVVESSPPKDFLDRWAASCGKKKVG